jgi:CheY-like chemotaxis protein
MASWRTEYNLGGKGLVLDIAKSAQGLSRGPLGVIALMFVLVYGMAAFVTGVSSLTAPYERLPLIYFLVFFPVLVLGVFAWLVGKHPESLYPPGDFKDEANFIETQKLRIARASASLVAAGMSGPDGKPADEVISGAVAAVVDASERQSSVNCVLWVDDRPENNDQLREAFLEFGIEVQLALSTSQALGYLEREQFSAIISDMGRREGPQEGYVLLDAVRQKGIQTPFFIYAGSNLPEHKQEALRRGAQGSTNNGNELFRDVTNAVLKPKPRKG